MLNELQHIISYMKHQIKMDLWAHLTLDRPVCLEAEVIL